jgi:sigma-B regulation protein RsbU (phosphoserine phosphatase)
MPGLFEPFHRGKRTKGNQDGLGLGLYIASQIAQAHGGMLEVTSDVGETTFRFRMPGVGAA